MTIEIKKEIMDKIEAIRIKKKLNKSEFARLINLNVAYYIRLTLGLYEKRRVATLTRALRNAQTVE